MKKNISLSSKTAYSNLPSSLKNEIFSFLQLKFVLNSIADLSKSTLMALESNAPLRFIKANLDDFSYKMNFSEKEIQILCDKASKLSLSRDQLKEICVYFLVFRYRKEKKFFINTDDQTNGFNLVLPMRKMTGISKLILPKEFIIDVFKELCYIEELEVLGGKHSIFSLEIKESFDHLTKILNIAKNKKTLKRLIFKDCEFFGVLETPFNPRLSLFDFIQANRFVKSLTMDNCALGTSNSFINEFCHFMKFNNKIKYLILPNNNLNANPQNLSALSDLLKTHMRLISLDLSNNNTAGNIFLKDLSEGLLENKTLKVLDIANCNLGLFIENFACLARALKKNKSLNYLNLSTNNINSHTDNMKYIAEGMMANKSVLKLKLNNNNLGSDIENIRCISEILKQNRKLQSLNLQQNLLDAKIDYLKIIEEGLKENKALLTLHIEGNFKTQTNELIQFKNSVENNSKIFCSVFGADRYRDYLHEGYISNYIRGRRLIFCDYISFNSRLYIQLITLLLILYFYYKLNYAGNRIINNVVYNELFSRLSSKLVSTENGNFCLNNFFNYGTGKHSLDSNWIKTVFYKISTYFFP